MVRKKHAVMKLGKENSKARYHYWLSLAGRKGESYKNKSPRSQRAREALYFLF
jgi:hypothetical protein